MTDSQNVGGGVLATDTDPRWKLPAELADIALSFDAGPDPLVNASIWTERYKFRDADRYRLIVASRGKDRWAITRDGGSTNLNWLGEWEYEPMNSSRTEEFFERTRFATPREALELANMFRNRITMWFEGEIEKNPEFMRSNTGVPWEGSDHSQIFHCAALAYAAHRGQFRKFSENVPYINHPASIAQQTEDWVVRNNKPAKTRVIMTGAAWGHDVAEDCPEKWIGLYKAYNLDVFNLIMELTNPSKQRPDLRRADRKKMDREHLGHVSWMAKVIKLIDRRSNLMEISDQPAEPDFKRLYARESEALIPYLTSPETKELEDEYMVWVRHLIDTKG